MHTLCRGSKGVVAAPAWTAIRHVSVCVLAWGGLWQQGVRCGCLACLPACRVDRERLELPGDVAREAGVLPRDRPVLTCRDFAKQVTLTLEIGASTL